MVWLRSNVREEQGKTEKYESGGGLIEKENGTMSAAAVQFFMCFSYKHSPTT